MTNRVICPACGKSNRLPEEFAGETIVCLACGKRFAVSLTPAEDAEAASQNEPLVEAEMPRDPDTIDMSDASPPFPTRRAARRVGGALRSTSPVSRTVLVAAGCLLLGAVVGT